LRPHLLDGLLGGGTVYEQLALLLLKHHARRKCPALEQRRTPRFPGAVIHLFKLLALAGVMRAALGFFIPSLKRGTVPEAIEPIPRLSLAARPSALDITRYRS
jgi:hypothetical protein